MLDIAKSHAEGAVLPLVPVTNVASVVTMATHVGFNVAVLALLPKMVVKAGADHSNRVGDKWECSKCLLAFDRYITKCSECGGDQNGDLPSETAVLGLFSTRLQ